VLRARQPCSVPLRRSRGYPLCDGSNGRAGQEALVEVVERTTTVKTPSLKSVAPVKSDVESQPQTLRSGGPSIVPLNRFRGQRLDETPHGVSGARSALTIGPCPPHSRRVTDSQGVRCPASTAPLRLARCHGPKGGPLVQWPPGVQRQQAPPQSTAQKPWLCHWACHDYAQAWATSFEHSSACSHSRPLPRSESFR